jgi:hypothetical protein
MDLIANPNISRTVSVPLSLLVDSRPVVFRATTTHLFTSGNRSPSARSTPRKNLDQKHPAHSLRSFAVNRAHCVRADATLSATAQHRLRRSPRALRASARGRARRLRRLELAALRAAHGPLARYEGPKTPRYSPFIHQDCDRRRQEPLPHRHRPAVGVFRHGSRNLPIMLDHAFISEATVSLPE